MAFNSLDAQREACEAYIRSQQAEGWMLLPTAYDDGGFSGGSMARPALQRLLADVTAGRVDVIVVYKVDRLTRALADFAKIVDVLDAAGASFISITQSFNTTSSMGRLTLNMLLSFAQFEREVIAERVRDKVAASRARGMWMGGTVPLGYRVQDRKLVPVPEEVATVRMIFERYLALGTVRALQQELADKGVRGRAKPGAGAKQLGAVLGRGALYTLLGNPTYVGRVRHKRNEYPGQQPAIIEQDLWDAVQQRLASAAIERTRGLGANTASFLMGHIRDVHGRVMSPTATRKGATRHRYYASVRGAIGHDGKPCDAKPARLSAAPLERAVVTALTDLVNQWAEAGPFQKLEAPQPERCATLADARSALASCAPSCLSTLANRLELRILASADGVEATISRAIFEQWYPEHDASPDTDDKRITLLVLSHKVVRPRSSRLVFPAIGTEAKIDIGLVHLLARARRLHEQVLRGEADPANRHNRRLIRFAWLAPDIVRAICEGRQPPGLNADVLFRMAGLTGDWAQQRALLHISG